MGRLSLGRHDGRLEVAFLVSVTALGLALRLYHLTYYPLRGDEAYSMLNAASSVQKIVAGRDVFDPHPPLYYVFLHYLIGLVGASELAIRLPSALAGALTPPLLYLFGRRLAGRRVAGAATLILALNPLHLWYSQDARAYAILALVCLGMVWTFRAAATSGRRRWAWAGTYVLLATLALYTHFYAGFLLLALGVWAAWRGGPAGRRLWIGTTLSIGVLALPLLPFALGILRDYGGSFARASLLEGPPRALGGLALGLTLPAAARLVAGVGALALLVIGGRHLLLRHGDALVLTYFGAPALAIFALGVWRAAFSEHYFSLLLPAFCLLLGAGLVAVSQRGWVGVALAGALAAALCAGVGVSLWNYYANPLYAKAPPWDRLRDFLNGQPAEGAIFLTNFPEQAVSYYRPAGMAFGVIPSAAGQSDEAVGAELAGVTGRFRRIWFLPLTNAAWDQRGATPAWLEQHTEPAWRQTFGPLELRLYLPAQEAARLMQPQPARFAVGPELRGFRLWSEADGATLELQPGETLELTLYWQSRGPTERPYTVFAQLIGADGRLYAQDDHPPRRGAYPTDAWRAGEQITDRYSIPLSAETPAGRYQVRVGLYDPATLQRSPVAGEIGASDGTFVALRAPVDVR